MIGRSVFRIAQLVRTSRMTTRYAVAFAVSVLVAAGAVAAPPAEWPQFRGAGSAGVAPEGGPTPPVTWSATRNVAWSAEVPGLGWSCPVVTGGRVFVTSAVKAGETERPQMGLYLGKTRGGGVHQFVVYCFDLASGKKLWEREVHSAEPRPIHLKNSFATETPCTDGERVYAYFGNVGVLACLDLEGAVVWTVKLGAFKTRFDWGTGASPVVHKDRVYVVNDNEEQSFVVALDKATGREVWRKPRERESNWATPFVWQNGKRTELVVAASKRVVSYDLDGNELWGLRGMSSITVCTPFAAEGLLYVASGYFQDKLRPVYAIRPGAAGDITPKEDEAKSEFVAWWSRTIAPYNTSPLVYHGRMYVLTDQGFLTCYDAASGQVVFAKKRIETGGSGGFTASPWAYGGRVFCLSEAGQTTVIDAGPEFKVIATNALDEAALANPAVAGESLVVRTAGKLYCVREKAAAAP